jgi:transposase
MSSDGDSFPCDSVCGETMGPRPRDPTRSLVHPAVGVGRDPRPCARECGRSFSTMSSAGYLNRPGNPGGSDLGNEDGVMPKEQSSGKPTSRRYSLEEKAAAVRMVRTLRAELGTDHGTVYRVARQLGYGVESVRTWVRQADIDDGYAPGVSTAESQRIKDLEQENRELKRANEILKRAASFFGAELDRQHKK